MTRDEIVKDCFLASYIESALWASLDDNDDPMDSSFDLEDLSEDFKAQAKKDCDEFQAKADLTDYPTDIAAHDFWLTRNHHGAGFWENDHGTKEQCEKLTEIAHSFGSCDLYVGDDGKIYC